jgi:hypothetical protein
MRKIRGGGNYVSKYGIWHGFFSSFTSSTNNFLNYVWSLKTCAERLWKKWAITFLTNKKSTIKYTSMWMKNLILWYWYGVKTSEKAKLLLAQQIVIRRNEPGECSWYNHNPFLPELFLIDHFTSQVSSSLEDFWQNFKFICLYMCVLHS